MKEKVQLIDHIKRRGRGKINSQETKEKISKTLKGRKLSRETKIKMRLAHLGKKFSNETRQKISKKLKNNKNGCKKK